MMKRQQILRRVHDILQAENDRKREADIDEEAEKMAAILIVASEMFEPKKNT